MGKKPNSELTKSLMIFKDAFYTVGLISAIINIILILPSIYMLQVYDRVLASRSVGTLIMISIIVIVFYIFMGVMEWFRSQLLVRVSNNMDEKLNERVFSVAFQNALYSGSGNASQVFSDFTNIRQFLCGSGIFAFFDIPWTPIYIIVIFLISPIIGVVSIVATLIMFFMAFLTEMVSKKGLNEANRHFQASQAFASVNFRNAEAIYAMGMVGSVKKHWFDRYINFLKQQSNTSSKVGAVSATTKTLRITFQSIVGYGLSAFFAIRGDLTAGMIVATAILLGRAFSPVDMAIGVWRQFVSVRESYARLEAMLDQFPQNSNTVALPEPVGHISVSNLIASPPNSNMMILKNVSFEVQPGELIGIIGPVASGKTTLGKMIVGIWPPYSGSVRLDGAEIHLWDREQIGRHIGYLPQDIELLDGTVAENIARFGLIDSDKVIEAAKTTGIHEMILQFPDGYDTRLGMGGIVISGGQKQRLALARAIYKDPTLIVLDEPNSNSDDIGERALLYTISKLKEMKKTVFMITHRPNMLSMTDKILFLLNGAVYMFGPAEEVIANLQKLNQQQAASQQNLINQQSSKVRDTVQQKSEGVSL